jgi:hypothetical protein
MAQTKDVKFIIYQVLYIFVVCVVAIKGANLDLVEVLSKEKVVEKTYADSLKKFIDSLIAKGIFFKLEVDTNLKKEDLDKMMAELRLKANWVPNVVTTSTPIPPKIDEKKPDEIKPEEKKPDEKKDINISFKGRIIQYSTTTMTNPNPVPMEIYADGKLLTTISPGSSGSFSIQGQTTVTIKAGDKSTTVQTEAKKAPVISMNYIGASGSLRLIQGSPGFIVKIAYPYEDPLDVKITGPVSIKDKGGNSFEVTLRTSCSTKDDFERIYADKGDPPYREVFKVTVKDISRGITTQQSGSFIFSDW